MALPDQGSETGDGPAMRLRGGADEAPGGGAPVFFDPKTMRVTTEEETLSMGCLPHLTHALFPDHVVVVSPARGPLQNVESGRELEPTRVSQIHTSCITRANRLLWDDTQADGLGVR